MDEERNYAGHTVGYWWDESDPSSPGWYAVLKDEEGNVTSDSVKIWWPVPMGYFGPSESAKLAACLEKGFPGATVVKGQG